MHIDINVHILRFDFIKLLKGREKHSNNIFEIDMTEN